MVNNNKLLSNGALAGTERAYHYVYRSHHRFDALTIFGASFAHEASARSLRPVFKKTEREPLCVSDYTFGGR